MKPRTVAVVVVALVVLHLVPIWAFKYFPSQDGPNHIENAYMLAHYRDADRAYREYYDINARPVPNWLSHAVLALLMTLLPPLVSEKVLLTAYVVLFVLASAYLINSTHRPRSLGATGGAGGTCEGDWLTLLVAPFIFNCFLQGGFYNFALSVPLALLAIGYWWRRKDVNLNRRFLVGLNLLLVLVYFSSILSQVLAVGSILLLAALHNKREVRRTLAIAAAMIPAYVLPAYYLLSQPGEPAGRLEQGDLVTYFFTLGSLKSFDAAETYMGLGVAAIFIVLAAYTVATERLGIGGTRTAEGISAEGDRVRDEVRAKQGFLVLGLALTALYFVAPVRAYGGSQITHRLSFLPFLVLLPWLAKRPAGAVRYTAAVAAVGLTVARLGVASYYCEILNRGLEEFTSGAPYVGKNATILPLTLDRKGEAATIRVFLHAGSYYSIASGAINLDNYEADKTYFPLKYKPAMNPFSTIGRIESKRAAVRPDMYPRPVDYILVWGSRPEVQSFPWLAKSYELIHSQGRLRLYRRVSAPKASSP
jgi:hypothetical protein